MRWILMKISCRFPSQMDGSLVQIDTKFHDNSISLIQVLLVFHDMDLTQVWVLEFPWHLLRQWWDFHRIWFDFQANCREKDMRKSVSHFLTGNKLPKWKYSQLPIRPLVSPHRTTDTGDATVVDYSLTETMRERARIQQPSVRLNPNLRKIKMDVDYNPIVEPKNEPLSEENEIETGRGLQLQSASLQMVK